MSPNGLKNLLIVIDQVWKCNVCVMYGVACFKLVYDTKGRRFVCINYHYCLEDKTPALNIQLNVGNK